MRNPVLSGILSFIIPGLGQLYNHQVLKAVVFFSLVIINYNLVFVGIGVLTGPLTLIVSIYDASRSAFLLNKERGRGNGEGVHC